MSIQVTPTFNELIYSVWNTVRSRANINDTITEEQIAFHILNVRAQLIKQDSNKGYTPDPYIIQDLGCVKLVKADAAECCQVEVGCTVLRTELPIPSTIELHHKVLITRIGPVDKTAQPYEFIAYEKVPYLSYSRFTKRNVVAYMTSTTGYMYFIVPNKMMQHLRYVNIMGVFEDPRQVADFKQCPAAASTKPLCPDCDTDLDIPCYTDDTPFPVKSWMIPTIIDMVVKMFIKPQATTPTDLNSDGKLAVSSQAEQ